MVMYKIKASDFSVYEITKNGQKKSKKKFPKAVQVAELFKVNNNLKSILDSKDSNFLKGALSKNKVIGERISILPDGKKLDKSFSLFSPGLTIHDEKSNSHWDVMFQNPNGKMAYAYTLEKDKRSRGKKYKTVKEFDELLHKLIRNLFSNIKKDPIALPMIILLKTKMRVGNEIYYKQNSHKGLTTLKKKDIKISKNSVSFEYLGKDGVPQKTTENFSDITIAELKKLLKNKKSGDFVFTKAGHPMKDTDFERAFQKYCGKKFYPHIVRSHFATKETIKFLEKNKKPTNIQIKDFCLNLANKLGHKKYSKKNKEWEDSYKITLNYYIDPKLVKKLSVK